MVVEMLKEQFGPCEPIVLSDIKWLKLNSGALRQAFKRMSDKGVINRYMNGVYYFPDRGRMPAVEDVIARMYVTNGKNVYGYFAGYALGKRLGVTEKVDEWPIIVTDKETSRGRFRTMAKGKVYLRKPYINITKDNVDCVALLDFLREWEMYSDLDECGTFSKVREYIQVKEINRELLMELAVHFPGRVSAILVKYRLV